MRYEFSGEKVKQKRKEKGMTLKELGEKMGIGISQLSFIERGERFPTAPGLGKLADALGVTPGYFYEKKEKSKPEDPEEDMPTGPDLSDLYERIRQVCLKLASPGGRVRLADLRQELKEIPREELDQALLEMQKEGHLVLMHLDDPQERTPEDDAAAIDILGFKRHILYLN